MKNCIEIETTLRKEDKEEAKKLIRHVRIEKKFVYTILYCPNCYTNLWENGDKYCRECGQKLDWSED